MTAFELIPVIDLMGGVVVHARAGERDQYRPLDGSLIAASAEPAAVVRGLLALHPFRTLYIADLDAIRKQGDHKAADPRAAARVPRACGSGSMRASPASAPAGASSAPELGDLVLGSESQADLRLLELLAGEPGWSSRSTSWAIARWVPPACSRTPERWPERVIAMTLARVGTGGGPDLERLRALRRMAPDKRLYAAGGVRGPTICASCGRWAAPACWWPAPCTTAGSAATELGRLS